ncbi:uncharacterized protein LOC128242255 isoform X2 [Mya arenaria]|nr:uncharacterized protein LOC128242255 isoform X2 [Mya arenaria]XP_052815307.1 uncharacterized protein LOC128242255 isoform X2 [Mya arenaria]
MTTGNLQSVGSYNKDVKSACVPPELVLTETDSDDENRQENIVRICRNSRYIGFPKVFHSKLNVVKITYIWVENHSSGFTLDFDFHQNTSCSQICDDRVCLSDHQLCDGRADCTDNSDEHSCPPFSQSTGASQSPSDVELIQAVAILLSVVLMPGLLLIICVVSPCPLASRMWPRRRRSRDRLENSQGRPESCTSEVVYVPSPTPATSQDKLLDHQISQIREHQQRVRSVRTDTMLDLPPQIPISKDGEEGYPDSQKHLLCKPRNMNDMIFRPPPNKTVHDRESPPPYDSKTASLENFANPANRLVRDSYGVTRMVRCFSMSSNVKPSAANGTKDASRSQRQSANTRTHSRTLSTNLAADGQTRTAKNSVSPNLHIDEPPDYEGVSSSDNNSQVSLKIDNV